MTLVPAAEAGEYDGRMTMRNMRIKDAPSMAALVNAISLVGLVNELSGQGILFSEVEAKFRLGSTHLIVHESSAVGPSIGLSMEGNYNLATTALDMRGVSPDEGLVAVVDRDRPLGMSMRRAALEGRLCMSPATEDAFLRALQNRRAVLAWDSASGTLVLLDPDSGLLVVAMGAA